MKKNKGTMINITIFILLIFAIFVALLSRRSYIESHEMGSKNIEDFNIIPAVDTEKVESINTIDQLTDSSDLIVKVVATNNREYLDDFSMTEVTVKEVYKGSEKHNNQKIKIFEPAEVLFWRNEYFSYDYYNFMIPDSEYILYLTKIDFPKELKENKKIKNAYFLSSSTFGKYDFNTNKDIKIIKNFDNVKYKEVKNMEIISDNKNIIEKYIDFKSIVSEQILGKKLNN